MPTDIGPEPAEWGISFGRFGSDSSASSGSSGSSDASSGSAGAKKSRRGPSSGRQGFPQSTSLGARSPGGQKRARAGRRDGGPRRASFDDPFGPVVGSSADAPNPADREPAGFGVDGPAHEPGDGQPESAGSRALGLVESGASDQEPAGRRRRAGGRGAPGRRATGWGAPNRAEPSEDGTPARSDEEWGSEARSILLRQLALGARSRHQLDGKLAERGVPPSVASAVLDRFVEVQLIDDAEFARMWVRTRTAAKSLSRASLRRELADKGIETDLAEDALLQVSDEDEDDQARDVVRRKLRSGADLSDRAVRDKEVRRLVGVLARKGYSPGTAFSIVRDVLAEAETDAGARD